MSDVAPTPKIAKQPRFVAWTDAERRQFLSDLGRGYIRLVSKRTWRRWRQRARDKTGGQTHTPISWTS